VHVSHPTTCCSAGRGGRDLRPGLASAVFTTQQRPAARGEVSAKFLGGGAQPRAAPIPRASLLGCLRSGVLGAGGRPLATGQRVARELDRMAPFPGLPLMIVSDNGTELTSNGRRSGALPGTKSRPASRCRTAWSRARSAGCATNAFRSLPAARHPRVSGGSTTPIGLTRASIGSPPSPLPTDPPWTTTQTDSGYDGRATRGRVTWIKPSRGSGQEQLPRHRPDRLGVYTGGRGVTT
jgi:hypothetical protein